MPKPSVFDTSIYIRALRQGNRNILRKTQDGKLPIWLSAVVMEELYVGASDKKSIKTLVKFERDFTKINRLLVPNQSDWSIAGQILNKIGEKHGFEKVGKARLTNDTLLAMGVARNGFKLFTANAKDFKIINEFREFEWDVI